MHSCFFLRSLVLATQQKILYNLVRDTIMQITPYLMRLTLLMCMLLMAILATIYLRQRRLAPLAYALWGLTAILIPVVGPFFVIWMKPGCKKVQAQG